MIALRVDQCDGVSCTRCACFSTKLPGWGQEFVYLIVSLPEKTQHTDFRFCILSQESAKSLNYSNKVDYLNNPIENDWQAVIPFNLHIVMTLCFFDSLEPILSEYFALVYSTWSPFVFYFAVLNMTFSLTQNFIFYSIFGIKYPVLQSNVISKTFVTGH